MNETKTVDLSKLSITEKKSLAYDYLAQLQQLQQDLALINKAIAEDSNINTVASPEIDEKTAEIAKDEEETNDVAA